VATSAEIQIVHYVISQIRGRSGTFWTMDGYETDHKVRASSGITEEVRVLFVA